MQDETSSGSGRRSIQMLLNEGYAFNMGDYISRGWRMLKSNLGLMVAYTVLLTVISGIVGTIDTSLAGDDEGVRSTGISFLFNLLVAPPLWAGLYLSAFKSLNNRQLEFSDFFKGFQFFAPLVLANLIIGIFIVIGTIFCVIPGIYLGVAYLLTIPLILDRNMGFWEAMETSRKVVTKNWFSWFVFGLLMFAINLGGLIACIVGLFFTIPLTYCMWIAAYEDVVGIQRTNI
ncbi:hypothetical protein OOK60_00650 [Trichothermofontia sichuanensis B231]|uniref:hypothetical protein n=1 Tax=Trichothermofontia sichuanensis TaxID=3045816 RepID=UPI00224731F6|nr:hypothetical protein [Trichothermofontia sichuanensis]UZQ54620.1 hypothetical protein OOK60_00650 [Trichothermofontia sichuanensis B231]